MESIIEKLGKASITVEKDYHSSEKEYNKLTVVEEEGAFKTYLSRKPVPVGVALTNREYWICFSGVLESITFDYLKFKRDYASGNALEDNSIITRHILDRNIERIKIALKAISEEEIDDDAVIERTIKDRNVTSNKIAKENILTEHFAKKSVITSILADYIITAIKLADNAVTTRSIAQESIIEEKLAKNSVTESKIADNNITNRKIANNAIDITKFDSYTRNIIESVRYIPEEFASIKEAIFDEINKYKPIVINGNVINAADEEDITSENNLLKLKDRSSINGMGYIILRKNKSFAEQVTKENTIYEIRYNFNLEEVSISLPKNCILKFVGGCLRNGTLTGKYTIIDAQAVFIFSNIIMNGSWCCEFVYPEWFGAVGDGNADDTIPLQKAFDFSSSITGYNTTICNTVLRKKYLISSPLESSRNLKIDGAGSRVIMKVDKPMFNFGNRTVYSSRVSIDGGTWEHKGQGNIFNICYLIHSEFKNLEFLGGIDSVSCYHSDFFGTYYVTFHNCSSTYAKRNGYNFTKISSGPQINFITFMNCNAAASGVSSGENFTSLPPNETDGCGLKICGTAIGVYNGSFEMCTGYGLKFSIENSSAVRGVFVSGLYFEQNKISDVYIPNAIGSYISNLVLASGYTLEGNFVRVVNENTEDACGFHNIVDNLGRKSLQPIKTNGGAINKVIASLTDIDRVKLPARLVMKCRTTNVWRTLTFNLGCVINNNLYYVGKNPLFRTVTAIEEVGNKKKLTVEKIEETSISQCNIVNDKSIYSEFTRQSLRETPIALYAHINSKERTTWLSTSVETTDTNSIVSIPNSTKVSVGDVLILSEGYWNAATKYVSSTEEIDLNIPIPEFYQNANSFLKNSLCIISNSPAATDIIADYIAAETI